MLHEYDASAMMTMSVLCCHLLNRSERVNYSSAGDSDVTLSPRLSWHECTLLRATMCLVVS